MKELMPSQRIRWAHDCRSIQAIVLLIGKGIVVLACAQSLGDWLQGLSLFGWVQLSVFDCDWNGDLSLTKCWSWIGVHIGHFHLKKEGPTVKPCSSRSGKCQGWKSFTLAHRTLFEKRHPWTLLLRYLDSPIDLENVDVVLHLQAYVEASENMLVADMASNKAIGAFGADALLRWVGSTTPPAREGMRVLTHCNTGR